MPETNTAFRIKAAVLSKTAAKLYDIARFIGSYLLFISFRWSYDIIILIKNAITKILRKPLPCPKAAATPKR